MDVTVDRDASGDYVVKLQTEKVEVNIRASSDDFLRLRWIRQARWDARQSIQVGRSAGSAVFWCSGEGDATVMIGNDDETWDIALSVPLPVIDQIVAETVAVSQQGH